MPYTYEQRVARGHGRYFFRRSYLADEHHTYLPGSPQYAAKKVQVPTSLDNILS